MTVTVTCDTCHVAAHGPQHLVGAGWGEGEPEWEMK